MMSLLGIFDFDIYADSNKLAKANGIIVVANHPTLIDVVVLLSMLPNADCIVKQSLFRNPFLKGVVSAAGYIQNKLDVKALIHSCDLSLKSGNTLIIFPEGTRTEKNGRIKLLRGAFNIALRCECDLLPVIINCNPSTLTKSERWYEIPKYKAQFSIRVGELVESRRFRRREINFAISARRLTKHLEEYFIKEQVKTCNNLN